MNSVLPQVYPEINETNPNPALGKIKLIGGIVTGFSYLALLSILIVVLETPFSKMWPYLVADLLGFVVGAQFLSVNKELVEREEEERFVEAGRRYNSIQVYKNFYTDCFDPALDDLLDQAVENPSRSRYQRGRFLKTVRIFLYIVSSLEGEKYCEDSTIEKINKYILEQLDGDPTKVFVGTQGIDLICTVEQWHSKIRLIT